MHSARRVLFIGAVTLEEASGSHAFCYRLFRNYPADKLRVVASHRFRNQAFPSQRLPGVEYSILREYAKGRRYPPIFWLTTMLEYLHAYAVVRSVARSYRPELIVTLCMDYHWYVAHKLARALGLPLILILHDRWENNTEAPLRKRLRPRFAEVFARAEHRFCISPTMARLYREGLGIGSDVLYPIAAVDRPLGAASRPARDLRKLVFFGNLWQYLPAFGHLARVLRACGIELVIFCNRPASFFREHGLTESNLVFKGFVAEHERILAWCSEHADVLYLPLSFAQERAEEVLYSFPSKLADYTALGLPLLIHAPARSSLVEFARDNAGLTFAEVAVQESGGCLADAVRRLADVNYRGMLGRNSRLVWERFFAPQTVRASFFDKVAGAREVDS
jgi:hypothetical protein